MKEKTQPRLEQPKSANDQRTERGRGNQISRGRTRLPTTSKEPSPERKGEKEEASYAGKPEDLVEKGCSSNTEVRSIEEDSDFASFRGTSAW